MTEGSLNIMRTAIILSIAGLCFSGSFSAIQYFPGAQAQSPATTPQPTTEDLNIKMAQLSTSNTPDGIATLAYIWGFPLVTMERQFNFVTSPNIPPGIGRGPANSVSCAKELANASFTDVVTPNSDTLYCQSQFDLRKEPVVIHSSSWMHIQTITLTLGNVQLEVTVVLILWLVQIGMERFLKA
jgi:hypothetical protein